jgi:hypothetical protein
LIGAGRYVCIITFKEHDMSHPRSRGARVRPKRSFLQIASLVLPLITTFFVIATPFLYIAGRAYHDGWYDQLKIDGALFPLDTAGTLTMGTKACRDFYAIARDSMANALVFHYLKLLIAIVVCGSLIHAFMWAFKRVNKAPESKAQSSESSSRNKRGERLGWILAPYLVLISSLSLIYVLVFFVASLFVLLLMPFSELGRWEAKQFAAAKFKDLPTVTIKTPSGVSQSYQELACGPQYCALWANGHAVTVPVATVTWMDSDKPNP